MLIFVVVSLWIYNFSFDRFSQAMLFCMRRNLYVYAKRFLSPSSLSSILVVFFILIKLEPQMEIERIELTNESASIGCLLQCFSGRLFLVDLRFDRETLNFSTLVIFRYDWIEICASSRQDEQYTLFSKIVDRYAKHLMS